MGERQLIISSFFPRKLYENDNILAQRGEGGRARVPLAPVDPPLKYIGLLVPLFWFKARVVLIYCDDPFPCFVCPTSTSLVFVFTHFFF